MTYDYVIAGAGLAGAALSFVLSRYGSVCVLEPKGIANGASGVAAGLVNPVLGDKANPVWEVEGVFETLDAWDAELGGIWSRRGLFRPSKTEHQQAVYFQRSAERHPDLVQMLSPDAWKERLPFVQAPFGGLFVPQGGVLDIQAFTKRLFDAAKPDWIPESLTNWRQENQLVHVETLYTTLKTRKLFLCLGYQYHDFEALDALNLHDVKGQVVELHYTNPLPFDIPAISGRVYTVHNGSRLILGSSFEHEFSHLAPNPRPFPQNDNLASGKGPCIDGLLHYRVHFHNHF